MACQGTRINDELFGDFFALNGYEFYKVSMRFYSKAFLSYGFSTDAGHGSKTH